MPAVGLGSRDTRFLCPSALGNNERGGQRVAKNTGLLGLEDQRTCEIVVGVAAWRFIVIALIVACSVSLDTYQPIRRTHPLKGYVRIGFQLADKNAQSLWTSPQFGIGWFCKQQAYPGSGDRREHIAYHRSFLPEELCFEVLPFLLVPVL
jgi:hypothetical protein